MYQLRIAKRFAFLSYWPIWDVLSNRKLYGQITDCQLHAEGSACLIYHQISDTRRPYLPTLLASVGELGLIILTWLIATTKSRDSAKIDALVAHPSVFRAHLSSCPCTSLAYKIWPMWGRESTRRIPLIGSAAAWSGQIGVPLTPIATESWL